MDHIGILYHPKIPNSRPLALEIEAWLKEKKVPVWSGSTWNEAHIHKNLPQVWLLVVLGGDGSMLRAARLALGYDVKVIGINLGRVGFLCEIPADDWQSYLSRVLAGDYWLEKRLMLNAELCHDQEVVQTYTALNEIVIGRGQQARVVYFQLWVNGHLVTQYTADSLIVATPTGSTAYSLAAGGPVLPPQLQNFVVVPVAAHLSMSRPLVLPEEATITIRVEMDHEAMLTADGQASTVLRSGDEVVIRRHEQPCNFARVEDEGYFYWRLMQRLGFPVPSEDG